MSGGVEINFRLMKWRYDLVLGHILPISQPTPPPGNNFTVPYYFIYFFNNLLTVINIYKYFNIAIEYQIKLYIIHVLSEQNPSSGLLSMLCSDWLSYY